MSLVRSPRANHMQRIFRIGVHVFPSGPFWVLVNEAIAARLGDQLVTVDMIDPFENAGFGEEVALAENVLAQDLDAFICVGIHANVLRRLAEAGLPVIYLFELDLRHPRFISPTGLYDAAAMAATYLARRTGGHGRLLAANGYMDLNPDAGASRLAGIRDALAPFTGVELVHSTTSWRYAEARALLTSEFSAMSRLPDAVVGLTDELALAAREAARSLGVPDHKMLIVGINGDPEALAAVLQGTMSATVRTPPSLLAEQAIEFALQAVRGEPWRQPFEYRPYLVTPENAAQVAAESLGELAVLPSRLVGVNRAAEQDRLKHLEVSAGINRHVGAFLDRQRLSEELEVLLKLNYGYDRVHILRWSAGEGRLFADDPSVLPADSAGILPAPGTPAAEVLRTGKAVLIPDADASRRWPPDAAWPDTRTRVILPMRLGEEILGLLDLHSRKPHGGLRQELAGLQATADQLAIALRNAELYEGALAAQTEAERADRLKTRLLANVSHELRTPLNIIMGYSKAALSNPNPYRAALPQPLLDDLQHIFRSGEHLIRLINDLLDLSRAEIGALDLSTETVALGPFLKEIYRGIVESTRGPT